MVELEFEQGLEGEPSSAGAQVVAEAACSSWAFERRTCSRRSSSRKIEQRLEEKAVVDKEAYR